MKPTFQVQAWYPLMASVVLTAALLLFSQQVKAASLTDFPASVDPGAILQSQMMNRYYQQLMFLQGPINIDDLEPKEPVIIDEQGILPDPKDVHGQVSPEKPQ